MRSTRFFRCALLASALSLAGCGNDDDGPPPFSTFVIDLVESTAEDTESVSLEGRVFRFDEDAAVFEDLFR